MLRTIPLFGTGSGNRAPVVTAQKRQPRVHRRVRTTLLEQPARMLDVPVVAVELHRDQLVLASRDGETADATRRLCGELGLNGVVKFAGFRRDALTLLAGCLRFYAIEMRRMAKPVITQKVPGEHCVQVWTPRGVGVYVAESVVDLPGQSLQLRADSAAGRPSRRSARPGGRR